MLQAQTSAYARILLAQIAAHEGHYSDAIEGLRDSIKRHDTWFARFLLGRVYLDAEHFAEAMAEFDLALKRRGEATDAFFFDRPTLRYLRRFTIGSPGLRRRSGLPTREGATSST